MTDKEIIKALECCTTGKKCRECIMKDDGSCMSHIRKNALDLINRQQAEIERLTEEIRILQYCNKVNISSSAELHDRLRTAKTEAIKEFWKKVRKHARIFSMFLSQAEENEFISYGDNLVKEMTEECEK